MNIRNKILVVNKDPDMLFTTLSILKSEGYDVIEAETGKECLQKVREHSPKLLILDVLLSDMDGFDVCEQIKNNDEYTKLYIILASGKRISHKEQARGLNHGADGYITRPFHKDDFLARIEAILRVQRMEEKLRESEEKYRLYFDHAPLAYQSLDADGNILDVNKAWLELLGYKYDEVKGKWFGEFLHPVQKDIFRKLFPENIKRKDIIRGVEFNLKKKNGDYVIAKYTAKIGFDSEGNFLRTHCLFEDVTEHKQAEEELQTSEEKYNLLVNNIHEGLMQVDNDDRILYVNDRICEMFGYTKEELIGKIGYKALIYEEDREIIKQKNIARKKNLYDRYEVRGRKKSGEIIWLSISGNAIKDNEGKVIGSVGLLSDITERKKAEIALREREQQLRNIFENSTNMFYSHTIDHQLTYVSPQVEQILGYSVEEAMKKWTEFASDNPINEIGFHHTMKAIETGKRQPIYELALIRKDGQKIIVEVRESPVTEAGKTVAMVGSLTDITDRKKAEAALKESEQKYRSIVQGSIQGMVIAQSNPIRLSFASEPMENITGYSAEELMNFKKGELYNLIHPDDRQKFFESFKRRIKGEKLKHQAEYRILHKEKGVRWIALYSSFIIFKGEPATQTTFIDITKRKNSENKLRELKNQLQDKVKEQTEELQEKVAFLQRYHDATVKRELRMKQLRDELEKLKEKYGE